MWIGLVRQYVDILLFPFHSVSRSVGLQVTPPFQTSLKGGTGELAWGRVPIGAERWLTPIHRNGCTGGYFLKCQLVAWCILHPTNNMEWLRSIRKLLLNRRHCCDCDRYVYLCAHAAGRRGSCPGGWNCYNYNCYCCCYCFPLPLNATGGWNGATCHFLSNANANATHHSGLAANPKKFTNWCSLFLIITLNPSIDISVLENVHCGGNWSFWGLSEMAKILHWNWFQCIKPLCGAPIMV